MSWAVGCVAVRTAVKNDLRENDLRPAYGWQTVRLPQREEGWSP
jgi:hypothetical protein